MRKRVEASLRRSGNKEPSEKRGKGAKRFRFVWFIWLVWFIYQAEKARNCKICGKRFTARAF
jgi:hypothetical protein